MSPEHTNPEDQPENSETASEQFGSPPPPPGSEEATPVQEHETRASETEDDESYRANQHGGYRSMPSYEAGPPRKNFPYEPDHPPSQSWQSSNNDSFALTMLIVLSLAGVGIFVVLALLIYRVFFGG